MYIFSLRWQVSGIQDDSRLEFGKENGTICCLGILQTSGLFCSPKVICLLMTVPFFLNQACEIFGHLDFIHNSQIYSQMKVIKLFWSMKCGYILWV